jgi:hypothetical protein
MMIACQLTSNSHVYDYNNQVFVFIKYTWFKSIKYILLNMHRTRN